MRDLEAVIEPAFYDHEQDASPRRERRVDDWGGDDLFASHPRRRFSRRPDHRTGDLGADLPRRVSGPVVERRPAAEPADLPAPDTLIEGVDLDETPEVAAVAVEPALDAPAEAGPAETPPAGRRTVVVTGRPGEIATRPYAVERRRPPRRPQDHFVARPDRVAAWAFGVGMLLVAVAVGTA